MDVDRLDLGGLRAMWARRREAAAPLRARTDPSEMTRPPRDPDEREFLRARGGGGPFSEEERSGWREWRNREEKPRVDHEQQKKSAPHAVPEQRPGER